MPTIRYGYVKTSAIGSFHHRKCISAHVNV